MAEIFSEREIEKLLDKNFETLESALILLKNGLLRGNPVDGNTVELDASTVTRISNILQGEIKAKKDSKIRKLNEKDFLKYFEQYVSGSINVKEKDDSLYENTHYSFSYIVNFRDYFQVISFQFSRENKELENQIQRALEEHITSFYENVCMDSFALHRVEETINSFIDCTCLELEGSKNKMEIYIKT